MQQYHWHFQSLVDSTSIPLTTDTSSPYFIDTIHHLVSQMKIMVESRVVAWPCIVRRPSYDLHRRLLLKYFVQFARYPRYCLKITLQLSRQHRTAVVRQWTYFSASLGAIVRTAITKDHCKWKPKSIGIALFITSTDWYCCISYVFYSINVLFFFKNMHSYF